MQIRFIGTSDGYPEKERFCSCTIVTIKNMHYVVDAGISLYSMMLKYDISPFDTKAIFITHMHGDHTNGLIEYANLMSWGNGRNLKTKIYLPTIIGKTALQNMVQAQDFGREVPIDVFEDGLIYSDENVKVTAYRTSHCDRSYGFLFESENKKVYFTGDVSSDLSDLPEFLFRNNISLVICESAHNRLYEVADVLNKIRTDKLVINHIAKNHSVADFTKCVPFINTDFELAYDEMIIEI